jgi:hypothetical protein
MSRMNVIEYGLRIGSMIDLFHRFFPHKTTYRFVETLGEGDI